ncbi:MAG: DUF1259 domain-containing protein [bacterium]
MVVTIRRISSIACCALAFTSANVFAQAPATPARWALVEQALGRKGAMQAGDVLKFAFPRSDLTVTVDGVVVKPALALGSWLAFKDVDGGQTMVMGDLVLGEGEVDPVMKALQAGGVEQTALHNHVLKESPRVMYMHISAHGDATKIAKTLRSALGMSQTPTGAPAAAASPSAADLDTAAIAQALGIAGKLNGVVYQVAVPRREVIRDGAHEIPPSMGVATAINFQPTGGGKAAITGDFVMRPVEVNKVIRALTAAGIQVSALHSHMLQEEPRLFFMHFWANDDAVKLAKGLRSALDQTAVKLGR